MQASSGEKRSICDAGPRREPLVLGYQGTLIPDFDRSVREFGRGDKSGCNLEFLVEPWLRRASRELKARLGFKRLTGGRGSIDLGASVEALEERLTGILTQVIADCPDVAEEQITNQFPVLNSLLNDTIAEWVDAICVFHQRLHCDAARLAAWLGYPKLTGLVSVAPASSDLHDGAHRVMRLLFGDGRCIYYKPRPVTGEWLWERLVHAVNAHSSLELASVEVLAGSDGQYGWVTSLPPHCQLQNWDRDSADARRYWRAAGATLCLAKHVRLTDLHMANVMATVRGPALFDAESLGAPRVASETRPRKWNGLPFAATIDDLLDTGLLPCQGAAGFPDISGLFGKVASVPQIEIPRWSSCPGGGCRLEMVPAALADHGNAPPHVSPLEVLPLLVSGYREGAEALMRCRERFLAQDSEWRWTLENQHAPRIILRDTLSYSILLSRSLQPKPLQSAERRRAALWNALQVLGHRPLPQVILQTEVDALLHLHVPRFIALSGSRTLASNSGRALASRFLSCSSAEAVLRKIGELNPDQLSEIQIPGLQMVFFGQFG